LSARAGTPRLLKQITDNEYLGLDGDNQGIKLVHVEFDTKSDAP